ncbi:MAG: hypothetical protein P8L44_24225 [Opitutales bacterium]|nr:hypothetical protein [Opitutales bacterium]
MFLRLVNLILLSLVGSYALSGLSPDPMESGFEWVDSDDVSLIQSSWVGDFETGSWESSVSLAYGHYSMDYQPVPFGFLGQERHLSERNLAFQWNAESRFGEYWTFMGGAGLCDGFTNYRSVWLDEYYRQRFSDLGDTPGAENYVDADPKGINGTAGARWEYKPGTGFAQINVSWLEDNVSPGYEIDFEGLRRGSLTLYTRAVGLSTENILSKRVRSYVSFRASDTTDRSTRYGLDAALHIAVADHWVTRLNVGRAEEDPLFEAHFGSIALERTLSENLSGFVDFRVYEDTGEIENALLFTSAAPGLDSERWGVGLRWMGEHWSARLYIAKLETDYEPTQVNTDFFQNLYADRDWNIYQFAISRSL